MQEQKADFRKSAFFRTRSREDTMTFFRRQTEARQNTLYLAVLYCAAVAATVALSSWVFGSLSVWLVRSVDPFWLYAAPALFFGGMILLLAAVRIRTFKRGGGAVAESLGGERIGLEDGSYAERRLVNVVTETAVAAGLPVPAVYLLRRDHSINAFAAGGSRSSAAIGITQGAVDRLTRDQLQAVVAHEFSHILNGDMRLNQILGGWLYGLQGIASSGRYLLEGRDSRADDYRRNKNVDNHPADAAAEVLLQSLPVQGIGLLLLCLGALGGFAASLVQAAVSRQREFLADASAVQFTRQTQPLIDALMQIARESSHRLHSAHAKEYAHMMFSEPGRYRRLTASHPTLLERISRLDPAEGRRLAPEIAELEAAAAAPDILFSRMADYQSPAGGAVRETERHYREREALLCSRIRRHRPANSIFRLPAQWQGAACDNEYASAALLVLCGVPQWAERQSAGGGTSAEYAAYRALPLLVHQQVPRLSAAPLPAPLETLEQLLPALAMQDEGSLNTLFGICRAAARSISARETGWLLMLAEAYLYSSDRQGWRTAVPEAAALVRPEMLGFEALDAALNAAAESNYDARLKLLRQTAATGLPARHPLLWRLLCVRLDIGAWAWGG